MTLQSLTCSKLARQALIAMASLRLGRSPADLDTVDGEVRPRTGGPGIGFGELIGEKRFGIKLDAKAPLRDPARYSIVGKRFGAGDHFGRRHAEGFVLVEHCSDPFPDVAYWLC